MLSGEAQRNLADVELGADHRLGDIERVEHVERVVEAGVERADLVGREGVGGTLSSRVEPNDSTQVAIGRQQPKPTRMLPDVVHRRREPGHQQEIQFALAPDLVRDGASRVAHVADRWNLSHRIIMVHWCRRRWRRQLAH